METQNKGEIIMYQTEDGLTEIQTTLVDDTVWLSIDQMAELFQRDKSTISRHIKNVYSEGELPEQGTVANFATVAACVNSPSSNMFLICLEIVDLSL